MIHSTHTPYWIKTYTGKTFDLVFPEKESICIEDIAHHLSLLCRFTGACREFYSVAQHSLEVAEYVEKIVPKSDKVTVLTALLHDAHEAYTGDISTPEKEYLGNKLIEMQRVIQGILMQKFELSGGDAELVNMADKMLLAAEARDLMHNSVGWRLPYPPVDKQIVPMTPTEAENMFLGNWTLFRRK